MYSVVGHNGTNVLGLMISCYCYVLIAMTREEKQKVSDSTELNMKKKLLWRKMATNRIMSGLSCPYIRHSCYSCMATLVSRGQNNVWSSVNFHAFYQNDWTLCMMRSRFDQTMHKNLCDTSTHACCMELHVSAGKNSIIIALVLHIDIRKTTSKQQADSATFQAIDP